MKPKSCAACRQAFQPLPQHPRQLFCTAPVCQRERRRRWHGHKLRTDPDYRDNQHQAQQNWSQANAEYWRNYRRLHPEYAARNRALQASRNARMRGDPIAKMDVLPLGSFVPSGIYHLRPHASVIAKMDAYIVFGECVGLQAAVT